MSTKIILIIVAAILINTTALSGCVVSTPKTSVPETSVKNEILPEKILSGGPPKDGIPSIDNPKFEPIERAEIYLKDNDLGIAVSFNGISRFYPNRILVWHEIVNDIVGKQPTLVTYCPLCGTGIVFEPLVKGKRTEFGTSGKLYNSNLVMYDRQTDSYWSQILGEAITGEMKGVKLKLLQYDNIGWKDWKSSFPNGEVLSRETGFSRDYRENPYGDYDATDKILFPVDKSNQRYHSKAPLFGLEINRKYRAYPIEELKNTADTFIDDFAGIKIQVQFNKENKTIRFTNLESGEIIIPVYGFWFSWYAVHPETEVYSDRPDVKKSPPTSASSLEEKPAVGFLAPDFTLKDYNGRDVRLSNFRGQKAVMLNFWAGWCPFCLAEMPAMAVVEEKFRGSLEVIAVNRAQKKEDAKNFTDALNLSDEYTILLNPKDDLFGRYGGFAMPSTFFIDKEGVIRDVHFGPLDSKQMKEKITSKLGL